MYKIISFHLKYSFVFYISIALEFTTGFRPTSFKIALNLNFFSHIYKTEI